jgi:hypothetical protein
METSLDLGAWYDNFVERFILKYHTTLQDADQYAGELLLRLRREVKLKYNVNTEFTDGILVFEGDKAQEAKEWIEIQFEAEDLNMFY